jgi:virginiamycin B lyase
VPTARSRPRGITAGPAGNLWFTESDGKIGRITPAGQITEFLLPIADSFPEDITKGPAGNLWFTDDYPGSGGQPVGEIGRITPGGQITEFPLPPTDSGPVYIDASEPTSITTGPDGNRWFAVGFIHRLNGYQIGRIPTGGHITQFAVPTTNDPGGITAGPDGNRWFTETAVPDTASSSSKQIGRITPAGQVTQFPLPNTTSEPPSITAGPDGNLWFTELVGNRIGRSSPGA